MNDLTKELFMVTTFHANAAAADVALVAVVEQIADAAGQRLLALYSDSNRVPDRGSMARAARLNEEASSAGLREALIAAQPGARWANEDYETTELPAGEWWVVDTVEGNVNHIHGLPEWCVSITLVRDGEPVLAVVKQPVPGISYVALRGGGAFADGVPMHASEKSTLDVAVVGTGQAEAGQSDTYRRIGESVTALLGSALMVRMQVPSTFPILLVAAGHTDAFWQYEPTLPGIAAGILFITESGGVVTTIDGSPWAPGAGSILFAAAGVHGSVIDALAKIA